MSFDAVWADLAPVGRAASGGYRRFAWTPVDLELREWFAAAAAGSRVGRYDRSGR